MKLLGEIKTLSQLEDIIEIRYGLDGVHYYFGVAEKMLIFYKFK